MALFNKFWCYSMDSLQPVCKKEAQTIEEFVAKVLILPVQNLAFNAYGEHLRALSLVENI